MYKAKFSALLPLVLTWLCIACAPPEQKELTHSGQVVAQDSFVSNGMQPSSKDLISRTTVRVISVFLRGGNNLCTGAVIAPNIILTAAHCVTDQGGNGELATLPAKNVVVENAFGSFLTGTVRVERILVQNAYLTRRSCPDQKNCKDQKTYTDYGRDIALIKLASNLPDDYRPAFIERDMNQVYQQNLLFAGYGAWVSSTYEEDTNASGELAVGRISLKDKIKVGDGDARTESKPGLAHQLQFQSSNSGAALCHGDSGGPVFYEKNGVISIVGVIVGFEFTTAGYQKQYRCARANLKEYASSVFSSNFTFLSEGFRELTGLSLPESALRQTGDL
jgi:tryptase